MTGHGVYDDGTPTPWPGSIPTCPMCGINPDHTRPEMTETRKPPGWWCTGCGLFIPPGGGTVTADQRKLWADGRRDRSHDNEAA